MPLIIKGKPKVDKLLKEKDVLWRYVDLAKFLDLVHNRRLFFQRGDRLEDKFEGAFTESLKKAIDVAYEDNDIKFTSEEFKEKLRERVFLNCWHKSIDDSMAMWQIYGRSQTSLAITTTVGQLRSSLQDARIPYAINIKKVSYIKHWRDPEIVTNPYSNVFAYKVKAYEFEKEVRVIVDRFHEDFDNGVVDGGMYVHVQIQNLLRSVVISPESPPWFFDLVKGMTSLCGIKVPIRRSKLATNPL